MNDFNSWESYRKFASKVKSKQRYIRDDEDNGFLSAVLATCESRKFKLEKGNYLWRAQLGCRFEPYYQYDEHIDDVEAPYEKERMTPSIEHAVEGRANPKGILILYLASDKETAMMEVRPWLGSIISVGQFRTLRDMVLIDCSRSSKDNRHPIYLDEPPPAEREQAVWRDIDNAFSRPLENNESSAEYIPTQILAELFKVNGCDGIAYKSMLGTGHNVALFDIESAKLVNCMLREVSSLSFDFKKSSGPYSSYKVK